MHLAPDEVTPYVAPRPEQPDSPQMPEVPPELGPSRPPRFRPLIILAVVVVVATLVWMIIGRSHSSAVRQAASSSSSSIPEHVLRLKGTTEAVQSRALLAPQLEGQHVNTLTIIRLTAAGTRVKKGDLLAEFDRQTQMRDFFDKQAEYVKLVDQVAGEQAKENAARAKDETELKQAENNLSNAELEIQKSEILSRIDTEKKQENLDEAKATYEQNRQTFDLKRKAARASIRILEIQRDRTQQTMQHAQANADLMQVRAPIDGVVVLNTIWKQGTMGEVQEGDQVEPGTPFMQVVDPATMQVRVLANQQDFPALQIGQAAKVRLDAYPELTFPARIELLAPIGENGSFSDKIRVFAVIVSIQGNNPKLMPDLSAAIDIDVGGPGPVTATQRAQGGS